MAKALATNNDLMLDSLVQELLTDGEFVLAATAYRGELLDGAPAYGMGSSFTFKMMKAYGKAFGFEAARKN